MPLYDTLGENAVEYIISHSGTSALFASADKLPTLAKALPKLERGQVSTIVYWGTGAGKDAKFEQARTGNMPRRLAFLPAWCSLGGGSSHLCTCAPFGIVGQHITFQPLDPPIHWQPGCSCLLTSVHNYAHTDGVEQVSELQQRSQCASFI